MTTMVDNEQRKGCASKFVRKNRFEKGRGYFPFVSILLSRKIKLEVYKFNVHERNFFSKTSNVPGNKKS